LDSSGVAAVPQTGLPLHARFIGSPFLDLLTTGLPLAGTEIPADFSFDSDDEFIRDLTLGFAVYGMPLTDPVFRISPGDFAQITEQRFSNGWLRIDSSQ
ncbi:MAG: hypothetical protein FWF22_03325, partial [Treponema sp.]|nr:hypothetical protein [Treponema sp.]